MQDHPNTIERLAQIAYSRTEEEEWRYRIYEAFFRMVNNAGLQCYYLAAKINTIEGAVEMGKAYNQVDGSMGQTLLPTR